MRLEQEFSQYLFFVFCALFCLLFYLNFYLALFYALFCYFFMLLNLDFFLICLQTYCDDILLIFYWLSYIFITQFNSLIVRVSFRRRPSLSPISARGLQWEGYAFLCSWDHTRPRTHAQSFCCLQRPQGEFITIPVLFPTERIVFTVLCHWKTCACDSLFPLKRENEMFHWSLCIL